MYGSVFSRSVFSSRSVSCCLLRCLHIHKSANVNENLSVRVANEHDFNDVLEGSKGIYDGKDYLPFVFHQWLKTPGKYTFVGELRGKIIAFEAANVIDGGQTIYCQSLRIHQEYHGRGYSYQMMTEVVKQVHRFTPGASKVRYMTLESNRKIKRFSQRLGYKYVMEKLLSCFPIPFENVAAFKGLYNERKKLHELTIEDAVHFVLEQRRFDHIIPNKIMVVLIEPYELMPDNANWVFMEGDKMFVDLTIDQLKCVSVTPRSFSHGRLLHRVEQQAWICNIHANERDVFKAHLIRHLMAAIEQLEKTGRKTGLEILRSPDFDFDAREVFREVLDDSQEDVTECVMCYDKKI